MLVEIPLTDDERSAVEGDQNAVDRLIDRLADVPTPAGPAPRALRVAAGPKPPMGSEQVAGPTGEAPNEAD
jgi:hypothetical protein